MSHTWENPIKIMDSRWWNGVMPPGTPYKAYIAKATEGDNFISAQFPVQYRAAEQLFGPARSAWSFHRFASNPMEAARLYHRVMLANGGYGVLPPVLDLEDTRAPADARTPAHAWIQLQEMEQLAGREVLCYTARWIWQRWAAFVTSDQRFYDRMLWEADPEPDTLEPGLWSKSKLAMVQVRLDFNPGGFNAVIDESDADPVWFNALVPQDDLVTITIRRDAYNALRSAVCS